MTTTSIKRKLARKRNKLAKTTVNTKINTNKPAQQRPACPSFETPPSSGGAPLETTWPPQDALECHADATG